MTIPPRALQIAQLNASYDGTSPVLTDVNLEVASGEIVVLVGASGSGKSTLFDALLHWDIPSDAPMYIEGKPLATQRPLLGLMTQKDTLLEHMKVAENATLALRYQGVSRHERLQRLEELAKRLGLEPLLDRWPHQLSGGQRQRCAFLRTVLSGARILLLDEPFSALDVHIREEMRHWIKEHVKEVGCSVLAVTHDIDEALDFADTIAVLEPHPQGGSTIRATFDVRLIDAQTQDVEGMQARTTLKQAIVKQMYTDLSSSLQHV